IYAALHSCKDVMDHFGGHPSAAGMSLHRDRLEEFEQGLYRYAEEALEEEQLVAICEADLEASLSEVSVSVIEQIEQLSPFGMANAVPKIVFRDVVIKEVRKIGKEGKHLKLRLQQKREVMDAISFG
ncbi:single-stranded-DNA-specific exonuclease RecJ, partial [Clostridium perfringens]